MMRRYRRILIDTYYNVRQFIVNSWRFRKELSGYYEFSYDLTFLLKSLKNTRNAIVKYGNEVDHSRLKKVVAMERAIWLLEQFQDDNFIELAEKELNSEYVYHFNWIPSKEHKGYVELDPDKDIARDENNRKIMNLARELEDKYWNELWNLIKGQDYSIWRNKESVLGEEDTDFDQWFDGSGIRGWWD